MTENKTVFDTKLANQPNEFWANTILYRLAYALGERPNEAGILQVDPDKLLEEVLFIIEDSVEVP